MKTRIKTTAIAALLALATGPALAQDAPPPNQCEINERFNDFDFWVGEWNVYSNDQERKFQGANSIQKVASDCLLWEHWTSARGNQGYSINYYDPAGDQWRQVWVSRNLSIDYAGGLNEGGAMVLEGTINYYGNGASFPFRGIWTPREDGSVVQHFDQFNPETGEWSVWFEGLYVRRKDDPNPPEG